MSEKPPFKISFPEDCEWEFVVDKPPKTKKQFSEVLKSREIQGPSYGYNRQAYFKKRLKEMQGTEAVNISEANLFKIKQDLHDNSTINYSDVRKSLRRLKLHEYYENIPYIAKHLNGISVPPPLTSEEEDEVINKFKGVSSHNKKSNSIYLTTDYVAKRLFKEVGRKDLAQTVNINNHRSSKYHQIWKDICQDLDWPCSSESDEEI